MSLEPARQPRIGAAQRQEYQNLLGKKQSSVLSAQEHIRLISLAYQLGKLSKKDHARITRKLKEKLKQSQQVANKVADL